MDSRSYDAFGMPTTASGSNAGVSQAGFASGNGYQEDAESGVKLLGYRYYDPGSGRFITRDPSGDGLNWYRYAGNNPLKNVDPDGLKYRFEDGTEEEHQDFLNALNNLAGTDQGDRIIWEILNNPDVTYVIRFHDDANHKAGDGSDGNAALKNMTIDTDDLRSGQYKTKDGKYAYYSWEHVIAHEAGHMIGKLEGPITRPDGSKDYSQEQKVVDEWENAATKKLGLPERGKYEDSRRGRRRPLPSPVRRPPPPGGN